MGNSESANPIRNMDKRTARREYRDDFSAAITRHRQRSGYDIQMKKKQQHTTTGQTLETMVAKNWEHGEIRVFARKRPIFQHEIENGEFDVISCYPQDNRIIIHDARMHNDMVRQMMHHHAFEFDHIFSEYVTNDAVYQTCTRPLVEMACRGGYSTALVYGQTGSGKVSAYSHACFSTVYGVIIVFFCFFCLDVYNDFYLQTSCCRYFPLFKSRN